MCLLGGFRFQLLVVLRFLYAELFVEKIVIDDALVIVDGYYNSSMIYSKNVGFAHIHTADYYWLTTEIVPA